MNGARAVWFGLLLLLPACWLPVAVPEPVAPSAFLFAHFRGNGEDGLHLLGSVDGYRWQPLAGGRSVLPPLVGKEKLLRDPCVARGPDGLYHVVWTCGMWEHGFGHAATSDFVHWTAPEFVPVMAHESTVRNVWAPELLFDAVQQQWVVFWASTIPGRYPGIQASSGEVLEHRLYSTTTRDWRTFTQVQLLVESHFSTIDGTFARRVDGQRFLLVVDDALVAPRPAEEGEAPLPPHQCLRTLPADGWLGPFGAVGAPFSPSGVAGPTALWLGDHFVVYYDRYRDGGYGAVRTTDFVTFEDVSARIALPPGVRHGTAFAVPPELLGSLQW